MKSHKYINPKLERLNKLPKAFLLLASLGLLVLLVGTFTLPFNQGLFSKLFTKPASHADTMMMGPQHIGCTFLSDPNAQPAFCDTFQTPQPLPRGRSGDLNPLTWDFSRVTGKSTSRPRPVTAQFCRMKVAGIYPPNDSFFCGTQFNEANHWMESFNDSGSFAYNDAMIRQPFDFTNRTGIITFEVDAKTDGGHMYWPDVWITDQPIPAPQTQQVKSLPKDGIDLVFSNNCNGSPGTDATTASLQNVVLVKDYQIVANLVSYSTNGSPQFYKLDCYTVAPDMANHFEIKVSQSDIQVWATDDDQTNFREIADAPNLNLNFSTGYVHFEHSDYNPEKFGVTGSETYHWHNLGFDGPILPIQRGYSVSNDTTDGGPIDYSLVNTTYPYSSAGDMFKCCGDLTANNQVQPFVLRNVDLSNATGAFISLDAYYNISSTVINYRVNGKAWHQFNFPYPAIIQYGGANGIVMPLPISELQPGNNTLELNQTAPEINSDGSFNYAGVQLEVGNIDLVVQTSQIPPVPPATYMYQPQPSVAPYPPTSFKVASSVSPISIDEGQSATISATVTNITSNPITAQFNMSILGPTNIQTFDKSFNNGAGITFQPNVPQSFTATYTAPIMDPKYEYAFAYSSGTFSVIESLLSPDQTQVYYTNSYDDQTLPLKTAESDTAFSIPAGSTPLPLLSPQSSVSPMPSMTPMPSSSIGTLQGDFNGDGKVDLSDLSIFAASFGTSSPNIPNPQCDLNSDGKVNLTDLSIFSSNFGKQ